MSLKKILLILLGILFLIGLLALGLTYKGYVNAKKTSPTAEVKFKDYFPFGRTSSVKQSSTEETVSGENNIITNTISDETPNNKLIQISDEPIAGYTVIQKEFFADNTTTTIEEKKDDTVTVTPNGTFQRELKYGSTGEDVRRLQQTLNKCPDLGLALTGPGSIGRETPLFVERTQDAVKRFQIKFKDEILTPQSLTEPTGILDELTRKKVSNPFVCKKVFVEGTRPGTILKPALRYIEKATGHIFDYNFETGETERITNTTLPRIQEAFFTNNGTQVLIRYLKDDNETIETYLGTLPERKLGDDTGEAALTGKFLAKNMKDITLSPLSDKVFYQTISGTSSVGTIYQPKTDTKNPFFNSPFSEWLPQWINENTITMTTKASGFAPGYMYTLKTTGEFEKVLGGIFGLTTNTSSDLKNILFNRSSDVGTSLARYEITTGKSYNLGVDTLSEKCIWNKDSSFIYCGVPDILPNGVYPDDWYQGILSLSDRLVLIDPTGLIPNEELVNPRDEGKDIDAINLQTDPTEEYLSFINKKNNILWTIKTR